MVDLFSVRIWFSSAKTVIVLGQNDVEQWLPQISYTFRRPVFWKWRTGEDTGTRARLTDDPFWEYFTLSALNWHNHGLVHPPEGAKSLVVVEEEGEDVGVEVDPAEVLGDVGGDQCAICFRGIEHAAERGAGRGAGPGGKIAGAFPRAVIGIDQVKVPAFLDGDQLTACCEKESGGRKISFAHLAPGAGRRIRGVERAAAFNSVERAVQHGAGRGVGPAARRPGALPGAVCRIDEIQSAVLFDGGERILGGEQEGGVGEIRAADLAPRAIRRVGGIEAAARFHGVDFPVQHCSSDGARPAARGADGRLRKIPGVGGCPDHRQRKQEAPNTVCHVHFSIGAGQAHVL